MATIITTTYGSNTAITMDLTSLAASATFIAGRESTVIDNTTNKYIDAIVRGLFIVGTTPTLPCQFNVYVYGADTATSTTAIDTLVGADGARTLTNTTVLNSALKLAAAPPVLVNTSNISYYVSPFSVAQLFGGIMPKFWGLFCTHNMTAAMKTDAGNTNSFSYNGITYTQT